MNNLRKIRQLKGLSAADIARKIGVTQTSYYRYEKGEQTLSAEILAKLADAMGVTADQILGREEITEVKKEEPRDVDIQDILNANQHSDQSKKFHVFHHAATLSLEEFPTGNICSYYTFSWPPCPPERVTKSLFVTPVCRFCHPLFSLILWEK